MLQKTIQVGAVTLTLGRNNGHYRYEGFTENSRMLIRQDPWGTWSGCIVKITGKGSMISVSNKHTIEEAGAALLEAAIGFHKALGELVNESFNKQIRDSQGNC